MLFYVKMKKYKALRCMRMNSVQRWLLSTSFTESLFGPLEFSRRDLAALNIQRGRDHGLADYNSVRESYGLRRKDTWEEINKNYNTDVSVICII